MELSVAYRELTDSINSIDEQLDSLTDGKAAGKRAITNQLIEKSKDSWESVVNQFVVNLAAAPDEVKIGVYFGIVRGLAKELQDDVNGALEKIVAKLPEAKPLIDPADAPELGKLRSDLYAKVKSVIALAEQFGEAEGMEMPRKRTGAKGKRGKRALSYFTWFVGEKEFAKLAEIVDLYDQYDKVADLTKAMREAGLNLTNPEGDLEFTLPDGNILMGINGAVEGDEDDSDEEDSDDAEG
jgi:hypothetical protein